MNEGSMKGLKKNKSILDMNSKSNSTKRIEIKVNPKFNSHNDIRSHH